MSEVCLHCSSILYKGECLGCLRERELVMINSFDMFDSKTFPMTYERSSLIRSIISFELEEIREKIDFIVDDQDNY